MGKVTGFLEIDRQDRKYRPASDRIRNFSEFLVPLPEQVIRDQASRCMAVSYTHLTLPTTLSV